MTTQEHLEKIKAKCQSLLADAEKRTPGRWKSSPNYLIGGWWVQTPFNEVAETSTADFCNEHDAAFIASCAGPAEAGWRATIAVISLLQHFGVFNLDGSFSGIKSPRGWSALCTLTIAAWPEELL